ncbi:hypothetical protein J31TS4_30370 [Paenibacillus sp. J31TS4]|uniref:hypothetical protein n=1 Tax=Paenibacillus sp. J31TS4 TaxID=2807195 RepID=UPI001B046F57|nr:hypothetical protein [Paenibacillus sp. J31TS4]GIP39757.1 hypothetical protein J31TS4_30370 [Paenibacillus sp. J31TS4]
MPQPVNHPDPVSLRLDRILAPLHPLTREDVIWALDLIKKKTAEADPRLRDLPQPLLLKHFQSFAETAMQLIHRRPGSEHEAERFKRWLREAQNVLL